MTTPQSVTAFSLLTPRQCAMTVRVVREQFCFCVSCPITRVNAFRCQCVVDVTEWSGRDTVHQTVPFRPMGTRVVIGVVSYCCWDPVACPTAIESIMQFIDNCERDLRLLPILAKSGDQETGWVYEVMVSDDHEHLYMVLDGAWTIHELKVAPEGGLDLIEVYSPSKGRADTLAHLSTTLKASKGFNLIL